MLFLLTVCFFTLIIVRWFITESTILVLIISAGVLFFLTNVDLKNKTIELKTNAEVSKTFQSADEYLTEKFKTFETEVTKQNITEPAKEPPEQQNGIID